MKGVKRVGELQKYTVYVAAPVKPSRAAGPEGNSRLAQAGYTAPE